MKKIFTFLFVLFLIASCSEDSVETVNDSAISFTEVSDSSIEWVGQSSVSFIDIDGDNDLDLFISGSANIGTGISKLYRNDGLGDFTEITGQPFVGMTLVNASFADIDGDNDLDLYISGFASDAGRHNRLYKNDGSGMFVEVVDPSFHDMGVTGSHSFADVDNDGDQDLLITGPSRQPPWPYGFTKLYKNNGLGEFSEVLNTTFEGVHSSSSSFADVDNDGDQDLLISGQTNGNQYITKLYKNNGSGLFTEVIATPFEGVAHSEMAFVDVDNDSDLDLLITGFRATISDTRISKLYIKDGIGVYTEVLDTPFEGVSGGSITFADLDSDNDLDLVLTGVNEANESLSQLYKNNGSGVFTEVLGIPFIKVDHSSVASGDIDGDIDLLITGLDNAMIKSALYLNNQE